MGDNVLKNAYLAHLQEILKRKIEDKMEKLMDKKMEKWMDQKMDVEDKMTNLMDQKMEQLQNSMESMLLHTLHGRFPKSDIMTQGNCENKEKKIVEP
jgi:hypothetical protein